MPRFHGQRSNRTRGTRMSAWEALTESGWSDLQQSDRSFLVYKHSPHCPVSTWAKRALLSVPELPWPLHEVDVIHQRPVSQAIAAFYEIQHESPQLLLVRSGKVIAHTSHDGVNAEILARWAQTF